MIEVDFEPLSNVRAIYSASTLFFFAVEILLKGTAGSGLAFFTDTTDVTTTGMLWENQENSSRSMATVVNERGTVLRRRFSVHMPSLMERNRYMKDS